jgi:hypothetical protein
MNEHIKEIEAGAKNLLLNCAELEPGDSILLVGEKSEAPYFDPLLCDDVAQVARSLGIEARVLLAEPVSNASEFPQFISDAMSTADKTIFFSRLGDQVRFMEASGNSKNIICYTLTRKHMSSPFASVNFKTMKRMHDLLTSQIIASTNYKIESDCGTSLSSEIIHDAQSTTSAVTEFTLELFPVMIFPPVNFNKLTGQIVLREFLLSSSVHKYSDSAFILKSPIVAKIENSRMVEFEGDKKEIVKLKMQLERAAEITGGDAYVLNSWHTGINPYTFFDGNPYSDLELWGTVAYGSPRYTHMHAAGNDPGDISIHLFDASISFDDQLFWDKGKFVFLDQPEVQAILDNRERKLLNSLIVKDIGLSTLQYNKP